MTNLIRRALLHIITILTRAADALDRTPACMRRVPHPEVEIWKLNDLIDNQELEISNLDFLVWELKQRIQIFDHENKEISQEYSKLRREYSKLRMEDRDTSQYLLDLREDHSNRVNAMEEEVITLQEAVIALDTELLTLKYGAPDELDPKEAMDYSRELWPDEIREDRLRQLHEDMNPGDGDPPVEDGGPLTEDELPF